MRKTRAFILGIDGCTRESSHWCGRAFRACRTSERGRLCVYVGQVGCKAGFMLDIVNEECTNGAD